MSECLFCRITAGELPAEILYQDEQVIAIRDIQPAAPVHVLVIPRKHMVDFGDTAETDEPLLGHICRVAARIAVEQGIAERGYRCVVNSGPDASQSVRHLHLHVLGGRSMGWPPG